MDHLFFRTTQRYLQALDDYPGTRHLAWLLGPKSAFFMEGMYDAMQCVLAGCPPGSRVLDFGCATGLFSVHLLVRGLQAIGMDVATQEAGVEHIRQAWRSLQPLYGGRYCFYNGTHIPFADMSFDGVVAHAVLEHTPPQDLSHVLCELYRIVRPGGHFFVFSTPRPQSYAEWIVRSPMGRVLGYNGHDVLLHEQDLQRYLKDVGFNICEFRRTDLIISQMPGRLQSVWNACVPAAVWLDRLLLKTPLSQFAHHSWVVCSKG